MQKTSLRKTKTSPQSIRPVDEEILHFTLPGVLSKDITLALNKTLGTLVQFSVDENGPRLVAEQQFTNSEVCVLLPLLNAYPHYCPYEVLLAHFNSMHVTEQAIERCRERLQDAQLLGIWDQEMRPVRNVLSRTRLKMHAFGMDIFSILETGYVLMCKRNSRQLEI